MTFFRDVDDGTYENIFLLFVEFDDFHRRRIRPDVMTRRRRRQRRRRPMSLAFRRRHRVTRVVVTLVVVSVDVADVDVVPTLVQTHPQIF